jgi:hypothetical protein
MECLLCILLVDHILLDHMHESLHERLLLLAQQPWQQNEQEYLLKSLLLLHENQGMLCG